MKGRERLIVALDTDNFNKAKDLIDNLDEVVDIFKVGLEQYIATKGKIVEYLNNKNKKIFLDLKFHDIPNTMKSAVRELVNDNVWMMTIHVSDMEGMRQVAQIAKEQSEKLNITKPIIVAVTVLTSLNENDLKDLGCNLNIEETVIKRAKLAKEAGIDGVVCSAQEASYIVEAVGADFVTVCPGIRPESGTVGDQKRVVTPAKAIQNGAHYLVVGRPITQSGDPKESALNIIKEIENA
jgi:orotidine-5'-phosphate decarboxylase